MAKRMKLILFFFPSFKHKTNIFGGCRGVNGVLNATAIPSQLNIAATFSTELAYIAGAVAGGESRLLNACRFIFLFLYIKE